jgi:hypothetical protein
MLAKNKDTERASSMRNDGGSPDDPVRERLEAWRKAVDRTREIDLGYICFLMHLEILDDDPTQGEWKTSNRKELLNQIRQRDNAEDHLSLRRRMMEDPISEQAECIQHSLRLANALDAETYAPDPGWQQSGETIKAVFNYFGLDPDNPTHRGFFLAIVTDVYLNASVRGRPKGTARWTRNRYLYFGAHVFIMQSKFPNANLEDLAAKMKKALPIQCKDENPKTLRKRLGEARRMFEQLLREDGATAAQWLDVAHMHEDKERQALEFC